MRKLQKGFCLILGGNFVKILIRGGIVQRGGDLVALSNLKEVVEDAYSTLQVFKDPEGR